MAKEKSLELTPLEESKRWLRRYLIRRRQAIPEKFRRRWSKQAVEKLLRSPYYKKAKVVATFLSFGSEIMTDGLVQHAWKQGKKVLVPMTTDGFDMPFFVTFQRGDKLKKTPHGPFELIEKKKPFPFHSIDLVILPGLGFDANGFRLGYGGGVYDRILAKTPQAKHIGIFYGAQFMPVLPRGKHDRKMHAIVTEQRVLI